MHISEIINTRPKAQERDAVQKSHRAQGTDVRQFVLTAL